MIMNYELLLPRGDQNPLKLLLLYSIMNLEHQNCILLAFLVGQKGPNKKSSWKNPTCTTLCRFKGKGYKGKGYNGTQYRFLQAGKEHS